MIKSAKVKDLHITWFRFVKLDLNLVNYFLALSLFLLAGFEVSVVGSLPPNQQRAGVWLPAFCDRNREQLLKLVGTIFIILSQLEYVLWYLAQTQPLPYHLLEL